MGAIGGLGGAIILVPVLVLSGWSPSEAAPLGLISVAAGSVAAAPRQLADQSVNHRLGVTTELAATSGAIVGALVTDYIADRFLIYVLAFSAVAAALLGGRRRGLRNPPDGRLGEDDIGERVGSLGGAYPVGRGVAPYRTIRLPMGLSMMAVAGLVAGTTGSSGGFIKTPVVSEIMHVPTKVAAGTTTFTIGVTSSAALLVFLAHGKVEIPEASPVIFGSLVGGLVGAGVQSRVSSAWVRKVLSGVLCVVATLLLLHR